jgi:hypothetical protein
MQVLSRINQQFLFPRELVKAHYHQKVPGDFSQALRDQASNGTVGDPSLYTAELPEILNWLHRLKAPGILEEKPCITPLLLFDGALSFDRLLFHYEGNPQSAQLIRRFVELFDLAIGNSSATIISPSFIPKSKMKEEQELIQLVTRNTADTSFIKFNFNRIGDFWSYAVKHECTLLVTTKNYQADLAKILFHFYKGGMWYNRLSFYLA